jgi:thioredoxin 1
MIAYITDLNSENFETFINKELSLVDIYATWCGPCKMISPIIDQVSVDFQGKVSVGKMDADQNRDIVMNLSVRNIPTILLFKNGEEVGRLVGGVSKDKIVELINENL